MIFKIIICVISPVIITLVLSHVYREVSLKDKMTWIQKLNNSKKVMLCFGAVILSMLMFTSCKENNVFVLILNSIFAGICFWSSWTDHCDSNVYSFPIWILSASYIIYHLLQGNNAVVLIAFVANVFGLILPGKYIGKGDVYYITCSVLSIATLPYPIDRFMYYIFMSDIVFLVFRRFGKEKLKHPFIPSLTIGLVMMSAMMTMA